ncbi:hypothetical protein M514_13209 [Trichuris suis]|uniref:CCHC-type domain-containing protein n=1 Tax=Trichuris suis TaxID=68888 RepID=A0A085NBD1_9BILA|nr:hypothetical protein M514_13209 [Trichuris suis]
MGLQDTAAQRHLLDKRPDSFDQAVQIAKQYRAAQASVENMQKRRRLMMTGSCQDGYATEGSGPSRTEKQPIVTTLERIEERLSRLEVAHQGDERRIRRKSHGEGTAIREAARRKAEVTCFVCATMGHFARDCPLRQRERNATEDSAMSLTDGSLSRESRRLPYVEVEFSNGTRVNALVDTGAVATFLQESLLEQCGIPMQPWKQAGFKGVDRAQVCPKGKAKLELTCLGRRLSVNAVVLAAPPCRLALGMDALTSLGVTLELSAQGPLVHLVNDRQPRDKEILPTRADSWTTEEPITSVMAGVTYGEQLNGIQRAEVEKVLQSFPQLFRKSGNCAAADHGITHRIPTQAVNPVTCRPYRVSSSERKAIAEQVNEMMRDGIVERSSSPWSFPVVMVQKRDSIW